MLILTNLLIFIFYFQSEISSTDEVLNTPFNLVCEDFLITGDWRQFAICKVMIESCYFHELSPPLEDLSNKYLEGYLRNYLS